MTEQEYQQQQADRKAANKILAQVKKAAKAHGHALKVVAPSWVDHWGGAGEDGLPTVLLQQEVYCTECFRSSTIYFPEIKQQGRSFGLASRLCRES